MLEIKNEKERKPPFKTGLENQVTMHVQRAFTNRPVINPFKTNSHYLPTWAVFLIEAIVFSVEYELNLCMQHKLISVFKCGWLPPSHRGSPGSIPGESMRDMEWT